jgi:hypothetical protein
MASRIDHEKLRRRLLRKDYTRDPVNDTPKKPATPRAKKDPLLREIAQRTRDLKLRAPSSSAAALKPFADRLRDMVNVYVRKPVLNTVEIQNARTVLDRVSERASGWGDKPANRRTVISGPGPRRTGRHMGYRKRRGRGNQK